MDIFSNISMVGYRRMSLIGNKQNYFNRCKLCTHFPTGKEYINNIIYTKPFGDGFRCTEADFWITKDGMIPEIFHCSYFILSFEGIMRRIIEEEQTG